MIARAINRRTALMSLAGATASSVALAVPTMAAADAGRAYGAVELSPEATLDAAWTDFVAAYCATYPEQAQWGISLSACNDKGAMLLLKNPPPVPVPFTGFGAYEIELTRGSGVRIRPFVALEAAPGGYRWRHFFVAGDRIDGKRRHYVRADQMRIVRKLKSLA